MSKKGGSTSTTQTVKLPPEIEAAAKRNIELADQVGSIGAVRHNAPSIAGLAPQQLSAMQGTDQAMSAFGMPSAVNWQQGQNGQMQAPKGLSADALFRQLTGMPPPNDRASGFQGYNTHGLTQAAINAVPPAQRALIDSFFINPQTGAQGGNSAVTAKAKTDAQKKAEAAAKKKKEDEAKKAAAAKAANSFRSSSDR